jgi:hypothetical protein
MNQERGWGFFFFFFRGVLVMSLLVVVVDERLSAMGRRLETRGGVRLLVTGC